MRYFFFFFFFSRRVLADFFWFFAAELRASWTKRSLPTLAVGLLDFKVYVVLALRQEPDCSAQWQRIPAVPNHQVSLQCPTAEYHCSAQPQSILSAQPQSFPIFQETLHFLSKKSFRVGMREVNSYSTYFRGFRLRS